MDNENTNVLHFQTTAGSKFHSLKIKTTFKFPPYLTFHKVVTLIIDWDGSISGRY